MRYIILVIAFLQFSITNAQEELSLFFHPNVIQSGLLQPAYEPSSNFNIGFGSTYFHADVRGPKLRDLVIGNSFLNNLASGLSRYYLSSDVGVHVFDMGFKKDKWHFRTGYNKQTNFFFDFSPDFAQLLVFGNGDKVGDKIDLGPEIFLRQTSELYFGASYPIYEYYRLGANLKFVSGSFDISTPRSAASLTTGEEIYEITLENDYLINTSYNSFDLSWREFVPFSRPLQDNLGVSADFGFQYLSEDWDISASLLDVGVVRWKSNPINVKSEGEYTFDGFSFEDLSLDTLEQLIDTLGKVFSVDVTSKSYNTVTPIKIVIGGEYHRDTWHFGTILYSEWKQNRVLPAIGINVRKTMWKFWDVGISYAIKNNTYSNVGLSSVMNLGAFQFYVLSDNVVGPFLPASFKKINVRAGVNLNFGRFKKPKQAIPGEHTAML